MTKTFLEPLGTNQNVLVENLIQEEFLVSPMSLHREQKRKMQASQT
jgi:hypothetical protein